MFVSSGIQLPGLEHGTAQYYLHMSDIAGSFIQWGFKEKYLFHSLAMFQCLITLTSKNHVPHFLWDFCLDLISCPLLLLL